MRNLEEMIEAAWQKSRGVEPYDPAYPVKASDNFSEGYRAGYDEAKKRYESKLSATDDPMSLLETALEDHDWQEACAQFARLEGLLSY